MNMLIADERKLNWRRIKLRQKTCGDESIMLAFATLGIVYWQAMPVAQ
jgi:hypothetical protein